MAEHKKKRHWPAIILSTACAFVFLISSMAYQVSDNEFAIVTRFGKIVKVRNAEGSGDAGMHWKMPYPIEEVHFIDKRLQHYERPLTQTPLKDVKSMVISVACGWSVDNAETFFRSVNDINNAEEVMKNVVGTPVGNVLPKYALNEIVTTDSGKHKLEQVRQEILKDANSIASAYGIKIRFIGISQLAYPPNNTQEAVLKRMKEDRKVIANAYRNQGKEEAQKLISAGKATASNTINEARIEADKLKLEGDVEASRYYAEFNRFPGLAAFLMKLENLKEIVDGKTSLVISDKTWPYDLLREGAFEELKNEKPGSAELIKILDRIEEERKKKEQEAKDKKKAAPEK